MPRGSATEDERDRRGKVAADHKRHHDQEGRGATGIGRRQRMHLGDGELLVRDRCSGAEGIRERRGHDGTGGRNDEERRAARPADERGLDRAVVDRVPHCDLARVGDGLEANLPRDRGRKRRRPDNTNLEVARLRRVQSADVRAHKRCLHEKDDEQREPEQLVPSESRLRLGHWWAICRPACSCVDGRHLSSFTLVVSVA